MFPYGDEFIKRNFPLELTEITEIIASGKPIINWDDIADTLLEIWELENPKKVVKKKRGRPRKNQDNDEQVEEDSGEES